jgi:hypothetical protein
MATLEGFQFRKSREVCGVMAVLYTIPKQYNPTLQQRWPKPDSDGAASRLSRSVGRYFDYLGQHVLR